ERSLSKCLRLSPTTIRHLELFETARGDSAPTLFSAINRTRTSAGARHLKQWLAFPLLDRGEILSRQIKIETWMNHSDQPHQVSEMLKNLGDIERRIGKMLSSTASARDLLHLAESIHVGFEILRLAGVSPKQFESLGGISQKLFRAIADGTPLTVREGNMIR